MAGYYSLSAEEAFVGIGQSQEDFLLFDSADKDWLLQSDDLIPPIQDAWSGNTGQHVEQSSVMNAAPLVQEQNSLQNESMQNVENGTLSFQQTVSEEPRSVAWTLPDILESTLAGPSSRVEQDIPESAQHQQMHASVSQAVVSTPQIEITGSPSISAQAHILEHACSYAGCDRKFDNVKSLRNHKKRCEFGKTPRHQCETCLKRYWHPKDKTRCINKHLKAKVQCPGCQKPYSRRDNMIRHLTSKHPDLPIPAVADSSPSIQGLTIRSAASPRTAVTSTFQVPSFDSAFHSHHDAVPAFGRYLLSASPIQATPAAMVRTTSNTTSFMDVDSTFSVFETETPLTVPDSFEACIDPQLLQDGLPPPKWLGPLF